MYKMRFYSSCLPRPENTGALFEEISIDIELSYIPQIGSSISVTPNHDYSNIIDVMHAPYLSDEYERISIHLQAETIDEFSTMVAEGWKSA